MAKKIPEPTPEPSEGADAPRRRRIARAKSYPAVTLEDALTVAQGIRSGGRTNSLGRIALATELDRSPASSQLRELITASAAYGLTKGNYNAETITLTEPGLAVIRPRDDEERDSALRRTALTPPLFANLYKQLDQGKWPPAENLANILIREHQVPPEFAEEAGRIAAANAQFVGILQPAKGGRWLTLNAELRRAAEAVDEDAADEEQSDEPDEEEGAVELAIEASGPREGKGHPAAPSTSEAAASDDERRDKVFISHSKNPKVLEQIKTVLDFGQFVPVIAEEEETTAIPVPDKVFSAMKRCGSAVINVSADEPERREDGTYGINQNVLIEVGVAFALFDRRVVLLVDKRVRLPSNLQGLYRSEYEGDALSWDAGIKLQRALANFRSR